MIVFLFLVQIKDIKFILSFFRKVINDWHSSAIEPRICKVLENFFWGDSVIKWVILYPEDRNSGWHVIGSRDNQVSKFEAPKNVGLSFL